MSFVDFMIIGAMKSGTTSLSQLLSKHPEVCFCGKKEPHFFSKSSNWRTQIKEYRELYHPLDGQICGEASTTYTFYPTFNKDVWQALHSFNPQLKLIYIMRDPVDRIVSHYMHCYSRGYTSEPFEDVVLTQSMYINISRYFVQIKPYIELFGRKQVLLLTFEEFISDKTASMGKIAAFLGIDASLFDSINDVHINKSVGEYKRSIKAENLSRNSLVQKVKPLFPKLFRQTVFNVIDSINRKKLDAKPNVPEEVEKAIHDLVISDVLEVEKLMGRELKEWVKIKRHSFLSKI